MNKTAHMRCFLSLAAAFVALSAQAFNWSDYSEGADVLVSENATATDYDMSIINSYSKLRFNFGTTITFDISGDVFLSCPVAATGTVVKCGTGTLTITASAAESEETFKDVDFEVKAGMLKMPQDSLLSHGGESDHRRRRHIHDQTEKVYNHSWRTLGIGHRHEFRDNQRQPAAREQPECHAECVFRAYPWQWHKMVFERQRPSNGDEFQFQRKF